MGLMSPAGGLEQLVIERGWRDLAAAAGGQHRVMAYQRNQMQTAFDEVVEADLIMLRYRRKPSV